MYAHAMFTGLVQGMGEVVSLNGLKLVLKTPDIWPDDPIQMGESICVAGVCLTVVGMDGGLHFDLSEETLARTTLGGWKPGRKVNLERAMKASDRFGGHIVQGHVDGLCRCTGVDELEGSWNFKFLAPGGAKHLVDKGSVALDGISLTIVDPVGEEFTVAIIPHTWDVTTLQYTKPGDAVNLEFDVLSKHAVRLMEPLLAQLAKG